MVEGKRVAVVIPAHNEQDLVGDTLAGIPGFVDRVIVVDDASTDATRLCDGDRQPDGPGLPLAVRFPSRRAAAAALAGLLVLVLVLAYAASMRKVWRQGSERASWTRLERELDPARQADLDPRVFALALLARRLLPPDATYVVVTGDRASPLARAGAASFAQYLLLPRRRVERAQDADWVLAYGADLNGAGVGLERVIRVSPGVFIARVRP